jgi:hypothetical protein
MILFLNKIDLFKEKIKQSPISAHFPSFPGGANYEQACAFFQAMFEVQNRSEGKDVYVHLTCATDTSQIKVPTFKLQCAASFFQIGLKLTCQFPNFITIPNFQLYFPLAWI